LNQNLKVTEGNELFAFTHLGTIWAHATVAETFPRSFAIWNLSQLLSTVSIFTNPDVEFGEDHITIRSGNSKVLFNYADPAAIALKIPQSISLPTGGITFDIPEGVFAQIQKTASVLDLTHIKFVGDADGVTISAYDIKTQDTTSNFYTNRIADNPDGLTFEIALSISKLMMLPGDYKVHISNSKGIRLTHSRANLEYVIALEADGTYNAA
jgi:hypothetical protein